VTAGRFVESARDLYDIVFVDPPFSENLWESTMQAVEEKSLVTDGGWIYVESPAENAVVAPANWHVHREGRAGAVRYALYRRVMPSAKL
jgi:16S rRNA (guanine966-N2)-methyltransferase